MKSWKKITLLSCYILFSCSVLAQGIVIDSFVVAEYHKLNKAVTVRSTAYSSKKIPAKWSLKKFCPTPKRQVGGTCSAWSTVYAAHTMLAAIKHGWTNQAEIDANAFDPMYTFNQVKDENHNCKDGVHVHSLINFMQQQGSVKASDTKAKAFQCFPANFYPPINTFGATIDTTYSLGHFGERLDKDKRHQIKIAISHYQPVIIILRPPNKKNWYLTKNKEFWEPKAGLKPQDTKNSFHAMTIVGYDDDKIGYDGQIGAFQLMNSWGNKWKDGGFVWVTYEDFTKWFLAPYIIGLNNKLTLTANDTLVTYQGPNISYQSTKVHPSQTKFTASYYTNQPSYTYLLITDTTKFVNLLFDSQKRIIQDTMALFTSDFTTGTDKLIALHTYKPIYQIDSFQKTLQKYYKNESLKKALHRTAQQFNLQCEINQIKPKETVINIPSINATNNMIATIIKLPHK